MTVYLRCCDLFFKTIFDMRTFFNYSWISFIALLLPVFLKAELRTWTDTEGRQMEAELVEIKDAKNILIRRSDGHQFTLSLDLLSQEDRDYIQQKREVKKRKRHLENIDWENPQNSDAFSIRSIRKKNAPRYIRTQAGWEYGIDCIVTEVEYIGNQDVAEGNVSAYFYDKDGLLVETYEEAPRIGTGNNNYSDAPKKFKRNEEVELYFPLSKFLEDSDWRTVVITFGHEDQQSVRSKPPSVSYERLLFPQKAAVFPDWNPDLVDNTVQPTFDLDAFTLHIKRLEQDTHDSSMWFDGKWQKDKPCVQAELRVKGDFPPAEGEVIVHFFDASGNLIYTRDQASMTHDGGGNYVQNPRFSDDDWLPIYFGLDQELKTMTFSSFVMVFKFGGKVTAEVESSVGASLDDLNFPEKSQL